MAIFHFRQSVVSAGHGHSAISAAAYRHATVMARDLTGTSVDFSTKTGGVHSEIAIPADAPDWIRADLRFTDPGTTHLEGAAAVRASEVLWNTVETGEKRRDAAYAIDLIVALPRELTEAQNIDLIRAFVAETYTAKGRVVDWAYHLPEDRQHNPHVHIMTTMRPLTEHGFGPKTMRLVDADDAPIRNRAGDAVYAKWAGSKADLLHDREAWATHVNHALAIAGLDVTVDHRSFKDRGITDIEPTTHRGLVHHLGSVRAHDEHVRADLEARARNFAAFEANPSLVLEHITRQQSTFDQCDVARMIHRYAGQGDDFQSLLSRVGALPELVTIQAPIHDPESNRIVQRERFTTAAVLEREAQLLELVQHRARDRSFAVDATRKAEAIELAQATQGFVYTPEQRGAIDRLTRDEGVSAMVGIAGAGKSTVLRAVNEVYGAEGVGVYGAALAGKAADNLQASSGIDSRTLASWEYAWGRGNDPLSPGDVFVIDEAGMVASAQMARVLDQLDGFGAKVVLVGDARQLQPIEAGAAFRSIASEVGYVELTEVRRQERSDHAEASVLFGVGETRSALDIYKGNDTFRVHDARSDALQAAITGWHHDWRANADTLILAHTNRDVLDLNALARSAIQAEGGLQDGHQILTARGMREFAIGDRVLFLDNDRALSLRNGSIGTVEAFRDGAMFVALPGRDAPVSITPGGYNHVDHGYATTIHKSQGSTVDRVHVVASGMMDAQLTYVALSRHREEVTMHVPLDAFTHPNAEKLATIDQVMDRLATDRLKDTSVDYRMTQDYAEARVAVAAERAMAALPPSLQARFEAFLEQRGLPHPGDVLRSVRDYAAAFIERARDPQIDAQIVVDRASDRAVADFQPSAELRGALNRLDHVQQHSAALNHEGLARRSAFFTAENELTLMRSSGQLRTYAERVADVVPPTLVVAIGRVMEDAHAEPRLAHLPVTTRDALQVNWTDVHAVSRAAWELGLLDTVRAIDTGYRQERAEISTLAEYERMVVAVQVPEPGLSPPTVGQPLAEALQTFGHVKALSEAMPGEAVVAPTPSFSDRLQGLSLSSGSLSMFGTNDPTESSPRRDTRFDGLRLRVEPMRHDPGPRVQGAGLGTELHRPDTIGSPPTSMSVLPEIPADRGVLRAALDRYAEAHVSIERHQAAGLPVLLMQTREMSTAAEALDRAERGALALLRSALRHDPGLGQTIERTSGRERAEALLDGLHRERRAQADPAIRADRFIGAWRGIETELRGMGEGRSRTPEAQEARGQMRELLAEIDRDPDVRAILCERHKEIGLDRAPAIEASLTTAMERGMERSRQIDTGYSIGY